MAHTFAGWRQPGGHAQSSAADVRLAWANFGGGSGALQVPGE